MVALLVFVLNKTSHGQLKPQCTDLHNMKSHISYNDELAFKQCMLHRLKSSFLLRFVSEMIRHVMKNSNSS